MKILHFASATTTDNQQKMSDDLVTELATFPVKDVRTLIVEYVHFPILSEQQKLLILERFSKLLHEKYDLYTYRLYDETLDSQITLEQLFQYMLLKNTCLLFDSSNLRWWGDVFMRKYIFWTPEIKYLCVEVKRVFERPAIVNLYIHIDLDKLLQYVGMQFYFYFSKVGANSKPRWYLYGMKQ